jgi:Polyketide cyclase / dehydrase and lipid transport
VIEVSQRVSTSADRIFAVLADGWLYPLWVVGASHMRDVDPGWPAEGTRIHHSVGPWPLTVRDATTVVAVEPGRMLELDARVWPTGVARVRLTLTPEGDSHTRVVMGEMFDRGPAHRIPTPFQAALMRPRNRESLRRLADIAEHRTVVCTSRIVD